MIYLTMLFDVVLTAPELNLVFAALCVWSAYGLGPRPVALVSAFLYVALAFS
jgi:hypothetical protein